MAFLEIVNIDIYYAAFKDWAPCDPEVDESVFQILTLLRPLPNHIMNSFSACNHATEISEIYENDT